MEGNGIGLEQLEQTALHDPVQTEHTGTDPVRHMEGADMNVSTKQTKIDFPEIETVSKDGSTNPSPAVKPGLAKTRFTNIVSKVMTKLYVEDDLIEEDNEQQEGQVIKPPDKNTLTVGSIEYRRLSRSTSRGSVADVDTGKQFSPPALLRRGNKHKFASLVRLAKYRKMISRTGSVCSDVSSEPEEEKVDLPRKPRFCATLSPEAQYAMLKGYEDLLLNNLKNEENEEPTDRLYRVKTPHHKVVSVHLNSLERRQQELLQEVYRLDKHGHAPRLDHYVSSIPSLPYIPITTSEEDGSRSIPKEKQIWLTHRFQCAMDILDKLREEKGQMATSPRYKHRAINPVANYNSWSRDWSREFKLEYTKH